MIGLSEKQKRIVAFPNSDYDAIICDGAVRSGKTSVMAVAFILWAMRDFNGCNFGICGKTVQTAIKNVISPLLLMSYFKDRGFSLSFNRADNKLTVRKRGKENIFYVYGGKDESSYMLIQGITLAGVMMDEVALMARSFVEQAIARCSVDGAKIWFNCNPETPQHWFYNEWILKASKKNAIYLHFDMRDNPGLSEKTIRKYEERFDGVFYDRYVLGLWVAAEGLVYPMIAADKERYVLRGKTNGIDGQFYVSIDYGTVNPCSMGLWCVQSNRAIRIKEAYYDSKRDGGQRTDEEHYKALEDLTKGYYIRYVVVDPSAASFIECIRRHGKYLVYPAENDVINGIRVTSDLLAGGKILIHESCSDSLREFGLYRWDEKAKEDKVIKANDHAMDDIRYFCSTVLSKTFRWADWRGDRKCLKTLQSGSKDC